MFSFTSSSPRRVCVNWSSAWCWLAKPRIGPSFEPFRDLLDWHISLGTLHDVVLGPVEPAPAICRRVYLAGVRIGAHDEILPAAKRLLVGFDTASTYRYLLSLGKDRDADTWSIRQLDLVNQRFNPEATFGDAGSSLRVRQALALPNVPRQGDVFRIIRDLETVLSFLEYGGYDVLEIREHHER